MKRWFSTIVVSLLATSFLVAASPVAANASSSLLTCTTRTSTPSTPNGWHFVNTEDWWQLGPLHANPSCNGYVIYNSRGWRFDATQCGQVWVRRPLPGGGTYIVPGSVKHICGGQSTVVVSRCGCQTFWVEAWPYAASDRMAGYWPLATVHW
jgi:hypothetical protein